MLSGAAMKVVFDDEDLEHPRRTTANSQQKEILASLLLCRNKQTGKLEMMAINIQAIADKNSAEQKQKYFEAMSAIAAAVEKAEMSDGEEGASKQAISGLVPKGYLHDQGYQSDRDANGRNGARMVHRGNGDRDEDDVADSSTRSSTLARRAARRSTSACERR